jgi:hypothetical protein
MQAAGLFNTLRQIAALQPPMQKSIVSIFFLDVENRQKTRYNHNGSYI